MKQICIAGKNNIAVDVLSYLQDNYSKDFEFVAICNKTDCGVNTFQRSFKRYCLEQNIEIKSLEELYLVDDLIFISLEFDRIIKPSLFKTSKLFNIHFSLLPAYKGMYTSALPILNGEEVAGVTFHRIDAGIDTGEIIDQKEIKIKEEDTCRDLYLKFINAGTSLVIKNLENILKGIEVSRPQPIENSTYYSKKAIDYTTLKVDLNQTAENIQRQIRAFQFREYQMPIVFGKNVIKCVVTNIRSIQKAGEIIIDSKRATMVSTIDYNIIFYYDYTDELLNACLNGDLTTVIEICSTKEQINVSNEKGWTPLIIATYNNQKEIVNYLITHGADIFAVSNNGTNLLMYAKDAYLRAGDNSLFKLFYNLGLSPNTKDYSDKDLFFYLKNNNISLNDLLGIS